MADWRTSLQKGLRLLADPLGWSAPVKRASYGNLQAADTGGVAVVDLGKGKQGQAEYKSNAKTLRELSKFPSVRLAIDIYRDSVARAVPTVVPFDPSKPLNKNIQSEIQRLFEQPNQQGESYAAVKEQFIEDYLVVSPGAIEIQSRRDGLPFAMYCLDAARFALLKKWDGGKDSPRYAYYSENFQSAVLLRNSEALMLANRAQSYNKLGMSNVEVLFRQVLALVYGDQFLLEQVESPTPGGALNLGENASAEDVEDVRGQIEAVRNAFVVMGGSQSPGFIPFALGERQMQVLERQRWFLSSVASVFQLPMQMFGQYQNETNRASMESLLANRKEGPGALLYRIEEAENAAITSRFGNYRDHNCWISYGAFNYQDRVQLADTANKELAGLAWTGINEQRERAGLEKSKLPIANEILVNDGASGLVPLSFLEEKVAKLRADLTAPEPQPEAVPQPGQPAVKPKLKPQSKAAAVKDYLASEAEADEWLEEVLAADADATS